MEIPTAGSYIGSFLVGAIPKLVVLILSAIVAATIADMYTGASDAPDEICAASSGRFGERRDRAPRICFLGVATSVISVFAALLLMQIEMIAICVPRSLKRVARGFGLILSILMCVFWLVTSGLLANLYREFCDELDDQGMECTDTDRRFAATPVLGFFCLVGWAVIGVISLIRTIRG